MPEQIAPERHEDVKPQRVLRIALAMRGGVSLAVWIGGAIAEIDVFRRACSGDSIPAGSRAERYHQMLERTGKYGSVDIDILAGASAGGLNAVLYGQAQTSGAVLDDILHSTWAEDGGMWDLLRTPGFDRIPSLLRGDDHFFTITRRALERIATHGRTTNPVRRLTVELAATLLADVTQSDRANRARFSFVTTGGTLASGYSSIPNGSEAGTPEGVEALDRLALAARATSSFPGAFEPASVFSATSTPSSSAATEHSVPSYFEPKSRGRIKRGTPVESRPKRGDAGLGINMSSAFPYAHWYPRSGTDSRGEDLVQEPYYVVDGGIFDNIPIDRAIRAIGEAPAAGPTGRLLIYLDPEPPTRGPIGSNPTRRDTALNWIPVIRSSLALKQRSETADDELSLLLEHNNSVLAIRGRLEALASDLRLSQPAQSNLVAPKAYVQSRIASDSARISALLTNPWDELCEPPRFGADYIALDPDSALVIKNQVAEIYNDPANESKVCSDTVALGEQVRVLLAWVRALEDLVQADELSDPAPATDREAMRREALDAISGWKITLYRWLIVLAEAKYRALDELLVMPLRSDEPLVGADYPMARQLDATWEEQDRLSLTDQLDKLLSKPGLTTADNDFYRFLAEPSQFGAAAGPRRLKMIARTALDRAQECIMTATEPVNAAVDALPQPLSPSLRYWTESVFALFYTTPLRSANVEQLAMLFAQTGIPDTASIVAYDRITSNEPVAVEVPALADAARASFLREWLHQPCDGQQLQRILEMSVEDLVDADAKLAGNVLSRFGGFLLTEWRRNDWQWGRLDTAAALTRILAGMTPPTQKRTNETVDEYNVRVRLTREDQQRNDATFLQESIVADEKEIGDVDVDGAALTNTVGGQTLSAVTPHYRFALASRVVPLIYRAILPGDSANWPAKAAAWFAQCLVRPLAVPMPLAADGLRATLAIGVILLSAVMLGVSDSPRPLHVVFSLTFAVVGALIAVRAVRLEKGWRTLKKTIDETQTDWRRLLDDADRWWYRSALFVLSIVVLGLGSVHLVEVIAYWPPGRDPHPLYHAMPFEAFVAATVLAIWAQNWLYARSSNIRAKALEAKSARARKSTRIVGSFVSVAMLGTVFMSSAVTPNAEESPHVLAWLHPALDRSGSQWFHTWGTAATIAGIAAILLTLISLWGWARASRVAMCCVGTALGAAILQSVFDVWWETTSGRAILDLLPTLVWMVLLGAVVATLPARDEGYGDPGQRRIKPLQKTAAGVETGDL